MLSLANSACPSSFQLQWDLRCRRLSTPAKLRVRLCNSDLRRGSCVVRAVNDGREEKPQSWSSPQGSTEDSFSGWFGENSGETDGSGEKKRYGGLVGAGLAGIFLAASMPLGSKRPPGVKQMELLTSQQGLLLSSNDQSGKDGPAEEKSDMKLPIGDIEDPMTGTVEDCTTSLETAESASDSPTDHNPLDSALSANSSTSEDFPTEPDFSPNPTSSDSKQSSSESNILDSSDESNPKDLPSDLVSAKTEVTVGLHENISATSNLKELPSQTTCLETLSSEHFGEKHPFF